MWVRGWVSGEVIKVEYKPPSFDPSEAMQGCKQVLLGEQNGYLQPAQATRREATWLRHEASFFTQKTKRMNNYIGPYIRVCGE